MTASMTRALRSPEERLVPTHRGAGSTSRSLLRGILAFPALPTPAARPGVLSSPTDNGARSSTAQAANSVAAYMPTTDARMATCLGTPPTPWFARRCTEQKAILDWSASIFLSYGTDLKDSNDQLSSALYLTIQHSKHATKNHIHRAHGGRAGPDGGPKRHRPDAAGALRVATRTGTTASRGCIDGDRRFRGQGWSRLSESNR